MKKMLDFILLNAVWIVLTILGLVVVWYAINQFKKPIHVTPTTKSVDFSTDSIAGTPVMENNPHANVFREAAHAAVTENVNPYVYLNEHWDKVKKFNGVEPALIDFIINEARQMNVEDSIYSVDLSLRRYPKENSIVGQYGQVVELPKGLSQRVIHVTTGHDTEEALYGTFHGKNVTKTFKLVCANGLVEVIGEGEVKEFENDYLIKEGDSFIKITGSTPTQANEFAVENDLPVRYVLEGKVESKTPNMSNVKVFSDFRKKRKGFFDVVLQPGDILRKKEGRWIYIRTVGPEVSPENN